jgi:serine protease Do
VAVALGLGGGLMGTQFANSSPSEVSAATAAPLTTGTFAKVAEAVKPAVVNIRVETKRTGTPAEDFFGEDLFRRFGGEGRERMPERRPQRGLGSGVIVDPSGVVLTNAHVVDKASEIEVTLLDGSKHKATVVGLDRKTDLAVLRLDDGKGKFPFARLGDSDKLQVGDWVLAVGSPFGLQATVTSGIVSAKARQIGVGPLDDFLQTDAAINPGNSGGPLVNMQGEVIGINTAIVAGGTGVGFAIPSNLARNVYTQIVKTGKVERGWLGVSIQPLTPELAKSFGVKGEKGILVAEVVPDSPAAKAGFKAGDVVVQFNGKAMEEPRDLSRAVAMLRPGQPAKVTVWRDGAEQTLGVTVAEAAGDRMAAAPAAGEADSLGLEVRPVTPEIARQLNLKSPEGVVVTRVEPDSPAGGSVMRGDVIREINGQPVKSPADFARLTKDVKKDQPLRLRVEREGSSLYVAVSVDKSKS